MRFNSKDIEIAEKLETYLGNDAPTRQEVYQQLIYAKNNINCLTFEEILRKDLKIIEKPKGKMAVASISGVLLSKLKLEEKLKALESCSYINNYSAIVLLSIKNDVPSQIEREICVFSVNYNFLNLVRIYIFYCAFFLLYILKKFNLIFISFFRFQSY